MNLKILLSVRKYRTDFITENSLFYIMKPKKNRNNSYKEQILNNRENYKLKSEK